MYEVIRRIVDDGECFDIKPQWAKTIITCFARFGGRPVGIVANQPKQLGGILDNDSADKAARFVNLCDAFNIPLVFLQDVPGFMVGTKVEEAGIIRHGAKMLYAVANATVPKITVVVRKAYGAGYYVMNGRAYEPDLIVAWPSAEICVMGAEGAVEIVFRKQVEEADDPAARERELIAAYRRLIDVYVAGGKRADRRRDRPARDAPDDLPRARDGRGQARRAAVEAARRGAGMSLERPRHHHLLDLRRGRQPRPVPGDPVHARGVRRRGAPDRRRGRGDDPHPRAHARTARRAYEVEDFRAITEAILAEVDDVIINYSTGAIGVPLEKRIAYLRELQPEVARAEHGLDELREVLARGARTSSSRPCSRTRSRRSSTLLEAMNELGIKPEHECFDSGHVAQPRPAARHGPAARAAAGLLRDGRDRRHPADRAQPRAHGRAASPAGPTARTSGA